MAAQRPTHSPAGPSRKRDAARGGPRRLGRAAAICAAALATLATASAGALPASSAAKAVSLTCHGGSSSCTAVVSLAGGASNEKLRIALSDTNLKLVGVVAKPAFVHGAYQLSRGTYSLGGSLYTATLNAVQSIPKGATLTLRFAVPTLARACGSVTKGVAHLAVAKLGSKQGRGLFSCQQANAVSNTWLLRFNAHEQVGSFSVNEVRYSCKLVPTLPQNTQCDGGGTRVKFSAPTGH
jgi:hypothetical protein